MANIGQKTVVVVCRFVLDLVAAPGYGIAMTVPLASIQPLNGIIIAYLALEASIKILAAKLSALIAPQASIKEMPAKLSAIVAPQASTVVAVQRAVANVHVVIMRLISGNPVSSCYIQQKQKKQRA